MREDNITKQHQLGIATTNPDIVNPEKPIIQDKYNNWMDMKKTQEVKVLYQGAPGMWSFGIQWIGDEQLCQYYSCGGEACCVAQINDHLQIR